MVMSLHILMSPKLIHVSVLHYLGRLYLMSLSRTLTTGREP